MPAPPAPRPTWQRRLREIATERLGLKAIALLIALLLWLVVSARKPTESLVRVLVSPALDSTLVLLTAPPRCARWWRARARIS